MSKRLIVLILVMVGLLAAVVLSTPRTETESAKANALVFPELQAQVNDIERITIAQGKVSFAIERGADDVWRVKEKANFPADRAMVREVIDAFSRTYFVEKRTAKEENYKALGLDEAFMRRVALYAKGTKDPVATLYVGLQKQARNATFVRLPGEQQTWLAHFNLAAETLPSRWLQKKLVTIPDTEIKTIVIQHPSEPEVRVFREKPGSDIQLANLTKDQQVRDPETLSNLFSVLNPLHIEDVRPASELKTSSLQTARVTLFDGSEIVLRFHDNEGEQWMVAETIIAKNESEKNQTLHASLKTFSELTEGYAFVLPYALRSRLTKKFSDLAE